jgi:hypothetical protein
MTFMHSKRLETGVVLLGAGMGALGAVLVEPLVLAIGAALAATATAIRISDRDKQISSGTGTPSAQSKPEDRYLIAR